MEFRGLHCSKCPYFDSKKKITYKDETVIGLCKIREKYVSEKSVNSESCKDKAVIKPYQHEEIKKQIIKIENSYVTKNDDKRFITF